MMIGKEAPDFKSQGYYLGKVRDFALSDYRGRWVLLEFYQGDFTFV